MHAPCSMHHLERVGGRRTQPCRGPAACGRTLWTASHARRCSSVRTAALPEFLRSLLDFDSWAPRSSRVWRLNQYEPETVLKADERDLEEAKNMAKLNDRIAELRAGGDASSSGGGGAVSGASGSGGTDQLPLPDRAPSFSDAGDAEMLAALTARISSLSEDAAPAAAGGGLVGEEAGAGGSASAADSDSRAAAVDAVQPLTGQEIWDLLRRKYGKSYDMSFVKRDLPGMPSMVSLNIMWLHLEQRSFKMDHNQYLQKLDAVAAFVNRLNQTAKVRAFLEAPAKSNKGLPRRPVVGTAVSIRLDLSQAQVDEWFGSSGM